ncbi:TcpQ domain-containing protein [Bordetella flabilis]|uniref:Toxin co-regulated pilus biosynthesis protein Q C-terminal domain-containing protein n=1 Tax=Bordetella flabilis TaxID=463014 RepID=A0A193GH97_9BORD|nr:TcpQ domain-containing protein [Bordetella flabilis]ANN78664.1 hypothetical protein BAU07_17460 [Bordetella flabilis]
MYRLLKTLLLLPWLAACAPPAWLGGASSEGPPGPLPGSRFDFDWRLSGDRPVAPLQVFDDGRQTWLQFAPGQTVPAIFTEQGGVLRPASYTRHEPYIVVQGKWAALVLRGGALQARADYLGAAGQGALPGVGASTAMPAAASGSGAGRQASPLPMAARPGGSGTASGTGSGAADAKGTPATPAPRDARSTRAALPGAQLATAAPVHTKSYRVGPGDENMRRALGRWATLAGWTFQPEHWAADVDIPLAGSADFAGDFKQSVRELLATTELGERPLQPCFYANRVLRVVPLSEACDRTAARPGAAS